jgi:hypothetical protein
MYVYEEKSSQARLGSPTAVAASQSMAQSIRGHHSKPTLKVHQAGNRLNAKSDSSPQTSLVVRSYHRTFTHFEYSNRQTRDQQNSPDRSSQTGMTNSFDKTIAKFSLVIVQRYKDVPVTLKPT